MIDYIKIEVYKLHKKNKDGHGLDHIRRVTELSCQFAKIEGADKKLTEVIALLHDVDDYKLVNDSVVKNNSNARNILKNAGADDKYIENVISEINRMGYHNALKNIRPLSKEGQIVSDADMCDAMGSVGILRSFAYSINRDRPFFEYNIFPRDELSCEEYVTGEESNAVCHMFEKILRLPEYMLTYSGIKEAQVRKAADITFLYEYFREEHAEDWIEYFNNYLVGGKENNTERLPHKVFGKKDYSEIYYDRPGAYIIPVKDGKVALVKCKNGYYFIGGGKEPGESNEECLRREVLEETGFDFYIGTCFATAEQYKNDQPAIGYFHPYQYYYTGKITGKIADKTEKDHDIKWFTLNEKMPEMALEMQQWALDLLLKK